MFQAGIIGYAPLLLETDWSTEESFEVLLEACDKVIANLQNDKKLSQKLIDSNSYLEWIKAIKDRHGSVEESSMTNVTQINESGVYTVTSQGKYILDEIKDLELSIQFRLELWLLIKFFHVVDQEYDLTDLTKIKLNFWN